MQIEINFIWDDETGNVRLSQDTEQIFDELIEDECFMTVLDTVQSLAHCAAKFYDYHLERYANRHVRECPRSNVVPFRIN